MPGSRISLVTRGANPLPTYPFPSFKSCDLREVAHGDRRVSSARSLHPEDVSLIGTTAGMASVAVQFDPERHLNSSPGCGLSTGLQSGSAEFIEWDKGTPSLGAGLPFGGLACQIRAGRAAGLQSLISPDACACRRPFQFPINERFFDIAAR
jgi:hypothetical protein